MDVDSKEATIETVSASKLLNYVKKGELIAFVGPQQCAQLENELKQKLGVPKVNLKQVKQSLASNPDFVAALRINALGQQAFQKYQQTLARFQDPTLRARSKLVRQKMTQPRKRYVGCLATKLQPDDYKDCYDSNYSKYDNLQLVPSGLKKHVFNTTDDPELKEALQASVLNPRNGFSDLPSGLRSYIRSNPSEFASYVEERKQELRLLRSVLRNMPIQEKQRLRAYFSRHKDIPLQTFSAIIRGEDVPATRGQKRPVVGQGENPFDIRGARNEDWDAESVFTALSDD